MGTVIVGFTGADEERRLRTLAEDIQARLELARQNALQRNREWGVHVEENSYRFSEFDPQSGIWITNPSVPLQPPAQRPALSSRWRSRALNSASSGAAEEELPDMVLFSSGEVTPFAWTLVPDWDTTPWTLSSDGLAAVTAEQQDPRRLDSSRRTSTRRTGGLGPHVQ